MDHIEQMAGTLLFLQLLCGAGRAFRHLLSHAMVACKPPGAAYCCASCHLLG